MEINHNLQFQSASAIQAFQEKKLKETLANVAKHSPFYQKLFAKHSVDLSQINTLADLAKLPLVSKDDLQLHNDDFLAVAPNKIIDFASTSGTLGEPVSFGLTDQDLERLAFNEATSFQIAGVQKGDLVQLMTTMDRRFMAGLAYFLGLRKLGAGIIRVGAGIPEMQWDSILKYRPKYLIGVPSFLLKLIDFAEKNNIAYQSSSIEGVICIGESLRTADLQPNVLAKKITDKWPIQLFSTYASTEMSTAFTECSFQQGGHLIPELIIAEILDENLKAVKDGELGELVVTTLGVEAMPLVRYRTGDMLRKHLSLCGCGRQTYRLGPVEGRKKQMIKYKGTTFYPPAMLEILNAFEGIDLFQIEVSNNAIGTDEITIFLATSTPSEALISSLKDTFSAKIRVRPQIQFVKLQDLQAQVFTPQSRKALTFVDKRIV